jgi:hypothetical protein
MTFSGHAGFSVRYKSTVGAGLLAMDFDSPHLTSRERVIVNDHRYQASSYK